MAIFRFDRGPTFFLYPRILQEIFSTTGHQLFDEVEMTRLDPQYRLVFGGGGQLDATPDEQRMEADLEEIQAKVCADCWAEWQRAEVMVINELRLNFMDPRALETLEHHMREFLMLAPGAGDDAGSEAPRP